MKILLVLGVFAALLIGLALWLWTPDKSRATRHAAYLAHDTDLITVAGRGVSGGAVSGRRRQSLTN